MLELEIKTIFKILTANKQYGFENDIHTVNFTRKCHVSSASVNKDLLSEVTSNKSGGRFGAGYIASNCKNAHQKNGPFDLPPRREPPENELMLQHWRKRE